MPPDLLELKADRCALRILEKIDSDISSRVSNRHTCTKIRRSAIDVLAGPVLIGYSEDNFLPDVKPTFNYLPDYLYPATRLLLISATIRSLEQQFPWAVKICGNTAEAMITFIQEEFKKYPASNGEIPDEVLWELPPGVEDGYRTNVWSSENFECIPLKK